MSDQGRALMGMGIASEEGRAVVAAQQAINSPLLEDVTIEGAQGILINITAGPDLKLHEVEEAASLVQEAAHEDCNIIFGAVIDDSMGDTLRMTVIATGFDQHAPAEEVLEHAIKSHGHRRQSSIVAAGSMGPRGRQTVTPGPAMRQPQGNPFMSGPPQKPASASIIRGGQRESRPVQPEPRAPSSSSSSSSSSGGWPAPEVPGQDPQDIPAFLRRRPSDGGDGFAR